MSPRVSKWPALASIAFLLLAAVGGWPYGFYTLLRLVVCGSAIHLAVQANELRKSAWVWVMGGTAVLFNPLVPVRLHRSDWPVLDFIGAVVFGISLFTIREKPEYGGGVLRTGDIVDSIMSKLEEPPVDPWVSLENEPPDDEYDQLEQEYREQNRLLSADPAAEAGKSASVVRSPFDLAERDITDPRVREWIDEEYRRATGIPIETEKPPALLATSGTDEETVGELYQCPSCGRSICRSDVLEQEWGNKAREFDTHKLLTQAGDFLWADAVENFKAFHRCERVPSEEEVARGWRKLAVRKVLRYAIGLWAVSMVMNLFDEGARWTFAHALAFLVGWILFFVVGVPLLLALFILWESGAAAWAETVRREWESWKAGLVEDEMRRQRNRERTRQQLERPDDAGLWNDLAAPRLTRWLFRRRR